VPRGPDQRKLPASRRTENGSTAAIMPDNAFIEAFNGRFRAECRNAHWFLSLADAREKMEDWRKYYNEERPHSAIGQKPPVMLLNHAGATSPPS
jgi:putative transposase